MFYSFGCTLHYDHPLPRLSLKAWLLYLDDSPQQDYHQQWNNSEPREHDPSFVHELIAGAASYEAAKAYEEHCDRNGTHMNNPAAVQGPMRRDSDIFFLIGQPQSHEKAKEIMAGFAGAFIDREVESRGLDFIDREKAKYQARQHIEDVSTDQVGY